METKFFFLKSNRFY